MAAVRRGDLMCLVVGGSVGSKTKRRPEEQAAGLKAKKGAVSRRPQLEVVILPYEQ